MLHRVLTPGPIALGEPEAAELRALVAHVDRLFLNQEWDASGRALLSGPQLGHTFDHQFRRMLHSIYTADRASLDAVLPGLYSIYGSHIVHHLYEGHCRKHRMPSRLPPR